MAHYEIDYSVITDENAKQEKALNDIRDYIGIDRFVKLTAEFVNAVNDGATEEQFHFWLSFAGIQGYPVSAWYKHCQSLNETLNNL